jgi:hypothetical protein
VDGARGEGVHRRVRLATVRSSGSEGRGEKASEVQPTMRTEAPETPPSLRWGVARLGGDQTHRRHALLYGSRRPQVSTKMSPMMAPVMAPVMAPMAGERILSLRVCALVASGALGVGGRHHDSEGKGKEDPHQGEGQSPDVAHGIPSLFRWVPAAWLLMVSRVWAA